MDNFMAIVIFLNLVLAVVKKKYEVRKENGI